MALRLASGRRLERGRRDHPRHAEFIVEHAEARRPEGFLERHRHVAAFGERREIALGRGGVGRGQRDAEAEELVVLGHAAAVGHHELRVADLERRVHDLVGEVRRQGALRIGRRVLEVHLEQLLRTERFVIERDRFGAIAGVGEVGLDLHRRFPCGRDVGRPWARGYARGLDRAAGCAAALILGARVGRTERSDARVCESAHGNGRCRVFASKKGRTCGMCGPSWSSMH
ncbi:hypothetical protein PUN4_440044 [Paraburkholderia unamae]|nr:hypothetical protein PUN4_440044 [Paraburkholderia unamae]